MKEIIKNLKHQVKDCKKYFPGGGDEASWPYEEGVLLTANEAQKIINALEATDES